MRHSLFPDTMPAAAGASIGHLKNAGASKKGMPQGSCRPAVIAIRAQRGAR
jgi:hypothetical protein